MWDHFGHTLPEKCKCYKLYVWKRLFFVLAQSRSFLKRGSVGQRVTRQEQIRPGGGMTFNALFTSLLFSFGSLRGEERIYAGCTPLDILYHRPTPGSDTHMSRVSQKCWLALNVCEVLMTLEQLSSCEVRIISDPLFLCLFPAMICVHSFTPFFFYSSSSCFSEKSLCLCLFLYSHSLTLY